MNPANATRFSCVRSSIADARVASFAAPFVAGIAFFHASFDDSASGDVGNHYLAGVGALPHVLFIFGCALRAIFRLSGEFSAARNARGFVRSNGRVTMLAIAFSWSIYCESLAVIVATSFSSSAAVESSLAAFSARASLRAFSAALRAQLR